MMAVGLFVLIEVPATATVQHRHGLHHQRFIVTAHRLDERGLLEWLLLQGGSGGGVDGRGRTLRRRRRARAGVGRTARKL